MEPNMVAAAMTTPDPIVLHTLLDMRTLQCPVCGETQDVPPVPVSNAVGEALGMSGTSLAAVHADQQAKQASATMRRHLEGHTVEEWLKALAEVSLGV